MIEIKRPDATSSSIELAEYCFLNAQDTFQAKILVKAAIKGRRDIVVMGHALGVNVDKAFQGNSYALVEITKRGDLEMVQFLEEQGLNISLFVKDIINAASSHGHVHILQWLHGTHALPKHVFRICFEAACEGRLDVIKWAENILGRDEEFEKDFMDAAAKLGHLNVVKWYRSRGIQWDELTLTMAAGSGNMDLIQHLLDHDCPKNTFKACAFAVSISDHGKALEVLKVLRYHGLPWNAETCVRAAKRGNIDVIMYARANGCPWDSTVSFSAACSNNYNVLEYCLRNGCPFERSDISSEIMYCSDHSQLLRTLQRFLNYLLPLNKNICEIAARTGHLNALKWARSLGCPWDEMTFFYAVKSNSIGVVQYCIDSDCPFDQNISAAAVNHWKYCSIDLMPILKLLHKSGYPWHEDAAALTAKNGDLKLLRLLKYYGCPWDSRVCNEAVRADNFEMLVFAHESGCQWTKETYAYCFGAGLSDYYHEIPTQYKCSDEIFNYLRDNNCPPPEPSDWQMIPLDSDSGDE